ncbi:MAG: hypothetical protein LAQ69_46410 [Acidobacteriia bacterium]|nr:hypothetical protein [Terriglobia bacterium]
MAVFDIYSKRQKRLRGDVPDVYTYDRIPQPLRVQIVHIWHETLGSESEYQVSYCGTRPAYVFIVKTLRREFGLFALPGGQSHPRLEYMAELTGFLLAEQDPEKVLSAIELAFRYIDRRTRNFNHLQRPDAAKRVDDAIEELNVRFREHGVGYQYEGGQIIRVDSQLLHTEAVKPALVLLRASEYAGAQAEFLNAHEHYRHGRMKEALADSLKAMESVMKAICAKRKWTHDPNATATPLVQILLDHDLIPSFWNQHFSALRSTLQSGVPTGRNKLGGHGQGTHVVEVPGYIVAYVLHMTASAIVFLAEAEKALP